jgi:hypothetical protein
MFQGQIAGYNITHEERLQYISQLAENLGYENIESLSLYVSQELLPRNDNNNDIVLRDRYQA